MRRTAAVSATAAAVAPALARLNALPARGPRWPRRPRSASTGVHGTLSLLRTCSSARRSAARALTSCADDWYPCGVDRHDDRERSHARARRDQHRPGLLVSDGPSAIDYDKAAFGAVERRRLEDDTRGVVVAQLAIGQADFFWLQDAPTPALE